MGTYGKSRADHTLHKLNKDCGAVLQSPLPQASPLGPHHPQVPPRYSISGGEVEASLKQLPTPSDGERGNDLVAAAYVRCTEEGDRPRSHACCLIKLDKTAVIYTQLDIYNNS